jgi:hypothetical protein
MDRTWVWPWAPVLLAAMMVASVAGPARSQQATSSAQRVDALTVEDVGGHTVLTIEGRFDPARIPGVMLQRLGGGDAFNLEIPGAAPASGLATSKTFPAHPLLKSYRVTTLPPAGNPRGGAVNIVLELQAGTRAALDLNGSGPAHLRVTLEGNARAAPGAPPIQRPEDPMAKTAEILEPAALGKATEAAPTPMDEPQRSLTAPWQTRPTLLRVAVLNASGGPDRASQVAVMLMDLRRVSLERKIGMHLEIANVSRAPGAGQAHSVVYYREGYLRAALALAEILPGEQALEPMPRERARRKGIDVEIWLGKDLS